MLDFGRTVRTDDLRGCSFDAFIDYAFDRPVSDEPWWFDTPGIDEVELHVDDARQLTHARELFLLPQILADRFTTAQINQGLWFMCFWSISPCSQFFAEPLWRDRAPLALRLSCVRAMYDLYAQLIAALPSEGTGYMWWDLLSDDAVERNMKLSRDQERVRQEMVTTLARILALDSRRCQKAALHGLNHVARAPERARLIDAWLATAQASRSLRAYARECRAGRAQ